MQSRLSLAVVVVAVAGAALGLDECAPNPGWKPFNPNECCNMSYFTPSFVHPAVLKCMPKYPAGMPPSVVPTGPPPPQTVEAKIAHACIGECVFNEGGLITSDKSLDKAAIAKAYTPTEASLAPLVASVVDKCYASYPAEVDHSLECSSGAYEFQMCQMKELVLNCPTDLTRVSTECKELKVKLANCPILPFVVNRKHGGQKQ